MRNDIAIVGSGPAGLSAAINAKIRNKSFILFGNDNLSSKIEKASLINNYLGFSNITGKQLRGQFTKHIKSMNIEITNKRINNIYAMGKYFSLLSGSDMFEATSVIISTGIEYTKPIKGEEQFLGRGVGYCATCDAPLYKNKKVAIIGYNRESQNEANYLNELTSKTYFIPMYKEFSSNNFNILDNKIEVIRDRPLEIGGKSIVDNISFTNSDKIDIDGVFVIKDSSSPSSLVPGIEIENKHIKVDANMATNIKGCFAAGDCVGKPYSYIKAAGQGQIAAMSAVLYLDQRFR